MRTGNDGGDKANPGESCSKDSECTTGFCNDSNKCAANGGGDDKGGDDKGQGLAGRRDA